MSPEAQSLIMKKIRFILLAMIIGLGSSVLTGCGSGVDQSDPRAVAEKALECYHNGDYKQLKTLVDPADKNSLDGMDRMIALSEKYQAEHPDYQPKHVEFSYSDIRDKLRGGEFTDATTTARVCFDSDSWPTSVIVVKVDGKWYFEQFK